MKLIVMGTGPFAVPSFELIHRLPEQMIKAVVTRPAADSRKPVVSPVAAWASKLAYLC